MRCRLTLQAHSTQFVNVGNFYHTRNACCPTSNPILLQNRRDRGNRAFTRHGTLISDQAAARCAQEKGGAKYEWTPRRSLNVTILTHACFLTPSTLRVPTVVRTCCLGPNSPASHIRQPANSAESGSEPQAMSHTAKRANSSTRKLKKLAGNMTSNHSLCN